MKAVVSVTRTIEKDLSIEEIWELLLAKSKTVKKVTLKGGKAYGRVTIAKSGKNQVYFTYTEQDPKPFSEARTFLHNYANDFDQFKRRLRELGVEP